MLTEALMLIGFLSTAAFTQAPAGDGLNEDVISRVYKDMTPAICLISYTSEITNPNTGETSKRDNSSAGLIVSPTGLVMAPGHMQIENSEPFNISVTVGEGDNEKKFSAKLLKKPEDINVCFVQLESDVPIKNLPYVRFTRDATLRLGEPVLLIGVLSETLDFARAVFTGRVGAIIEKPRTTYCLDSAIRFGFVGGPVANARGQVVGVIGFDLTTAEGGDLYVRSGHPLIYQAGLFQKYIDNPPSESEVRATGEEAWLGIFSQPLTDEFAEYWGVEKTGGILISSLVAGSPAEAAGLQPGDIIKRFNDVPIKAKLDREVIGFTKLVRDTGTGKTVEIQLLRQGKPMTLQVALATRPKSARDAGEFKDEVFGLTVREITTDVRILLNLSEDVKGVIVRRVRSGSVADLAGMRSGVIILSMGDHPVTTIEEFKKAVEQLAAEKPKEIPVFCRAGSATGFFRLEPRWDAGAGK